MSHDDHAFETTSKKGVFVMARHRDAVYESNLRCLLDAVLHAQPSERSNLIVHRLRHSLLAAAQSSSIPFDADHALKSNYEHVVPSAETVFTKQRPNPLNSVFPDWDYTILREDLESTWEPDLISDISSEKDLLLEENYVGLLEPSRKKSKKQEGSTLSPLPKNKGNKGNVVKTERMSRPSYQDDVIRNDEKSTISQEENKLKTFSQYVWERFTSGNNGSCPFSQNTKEDVPKSLNPFDKQGSYNVTDSNSVLHALKGVSKDDRIFLANLNEDGSTNMFSSYNTYHFNATSMLIVIDFDNSIAVPQHFVYPFRARCSSENSVLEKIFNSPAVKIGFDFKFIFRGILSVFNPIPSILSKLGGKLFDLKLAAWLLYTDLPTTALTLDAISFRMRCNEKICIKKPIFTLDQFSPIAREGFSEMWLQYAAMLQIQAQENRALFDAVNFESKIALILASMESVGVNVDNDFLQTQRTKIKKCLQEVEQRCHEIAGHKFNLASPDQVASVLYDELGLIAKTKLQSGRRSTAESVLDSLRQYHILPGIILQYRTLSKLLGSYIEPLISASKSTGGIVRTSWNQCSCSTGRLSSSGPNLQSLPKDVIREEKREVVNDFGAVIRRAFVCDSESILISADYKQMEVRVFAFLSRDEHLMQAISNCCDVYQALGAIIFNKHTSSINALEKSQAKTIFLALMYGMGSLSLSKQLSLLTKSAFTVAEACVFSKNIAAQFPQMQKFVSSTIAFCRNHGYVETITGRRRYLPDISSTDDRKRRQAERQAVNSVIQGSSSDIMKSAMLKLLLLFEQHSISGTAAIRLQVHDELVVSCRATNFGLVCRLVATAMQENDVTIQLKGQLQVSIQAGQNLHDLAPFDYSDREE